jgi:agmatinase
MSHPFDPDAAARPGSGIFGLPCSRDQARVILLPVPFDATTSYGGGAAAGPAAILQASAQVDLHDTQFGPVYERGIFMEDEPHSIRALSRRCRDLALPIIRRGGPADSPDRDEAHALATVNAAGEQVNQFVHDRVAAILREGKLPGLVGGDHSTPFGAILACAEHTARETEREGGGLGVLHIDAHMDLREAFEGFTWSHASIMHNVLARIPQVTRLVQVGLRDVGRAEVALARSMPGRVFPQFDLDWARDLEDGHRFTDLCRRAVEPLPALVYVSFDIDGLDPSLCPHTGTPVPGGLSFNQACLLLQALRDSGRRVVGFDLVEVAPASRDAPSPPGEPPAPEWDANVGARILYKLCGLAPDS